MARDLTYINTAPLEVSVRDGGQTLCRLRRRDLREGETAHQSQSLVIVAGHLCRHTRGAAERIGALEPLCRVPEGVQLPTGQPLPGVDWDLETAGELELLSVSPGWEPEADAAARVAAWAEAARADPAS